MTPSWPPPPRSCRRRCTLVRQVAADGRLPVVLFCAGGIATPADASLVMQLGAEGVFVGSGIFKSEDPERRARAIVEATTHFQDPARVAAASTGLGQAMVSLETSQARVRAAAGPAAAGSRWRRPAAGAQTPLVGVLALQGGFEAHARVLERSAPARAKYACRPTWRVWMP